MTQVKTIEELTASEEIKTSGHHVGVEKKIVKRPTKRKKSTGTNPVSKESNHKSEQEKPELQSLSSSVAKPVDTNSDTFSLSNESESVAAEEAQELEEGYTRQGLKSSHNQELGYRGETAAIRYLERKGFYIHDRNWRCNAGEVDIVAEDEETLVFVEVKTRSNCDKGLPEEAVDATKRKRYERIAGYYLREHDFLEKSVRFDVISLLVVAPERAFLRHHLNAFAVDSY